MRYMGESAHQRIQKDEPSAGGQRARRRIQNRRIRGRKPGVSKGKGFRGGVKRWHLPRRRRVIRFHVHHRAPGQRASARARFPSRVWKKGSTSQGTWETRARRSKNLRVVRIDSEENLLLVRGAVPGPAGSYIFTFTREKTGQHGRERRQCLLLDVKNLGRRDRRPGRS